MDKKTYHKMIAKANSLQLQREYVKATAYCNFALSLCDDEALKIATLNKITEIELEFITFISKKGSKSTLDDLGIPHISNHQHPSDILLENRHQPYKTSLKRFREQFKLKVEANRDHTKSRQYHLEATNETKRLLTQFIIEAKAVLGEPPYNMKYAIIAMGSMARDEMTPFSDIEFAILLDSHVDIDRHTRKELKSVDLDKVKKYFRHLTEYIFIKILNLTETTPKIANLTFANSHHVEIINGISYDGQSEAGCKTPLGNAHLLLGDKTFELIGTTSELTQYFTEDWLKKNMHLLSVLSNTCFIEGDSDLLQEFNDKRNIALNTQIQTAEMFSGQTLTLRQKMVQELMKETCDNFFPTGDNVDNIKYSFYRLPTLILDHLSFLYEIKENNSWGIIEKLGKEGKKVIKNDSDALNLIELVNQASSHRLRNYLKHGNQLDNFAISDRDPNIATDTYIISPLEAEKILIMLANIHSQINIQSRSNFFDFNNEFKLEVDDKVLKVDFYRNIIDKIVRKNTTIRDEYPATIQQSQMELTLDKKLRRISKNGDLDALKTLYYKDDEEIIIHDDKGHNILITAACYGYCDMVKWILEEGVIGGFDIDEKNAKDKGKTLLHYAVMGPKANIDLVSYLVDEAESDITIESEDGKVPLNYAKKPKIKEFLVEKTSQNNSRGSLSPQCETVNDGIQR